MAYELTDAIKINADTGGNNAGNGGNAHNEGDLLNNPTLTFNPSQTVTGSEVDATAGDFVSHFGSWGGGGGGAGDGGNNFGLSSGGFGDGGNAFGLNIGGAGDGPAGPGGAATSTQTAGAGPGGAATLGQTAGAGPGGAGGESNGSIGSESGHDTAAVSANTSGTMSNYLLADQHANFVGAVGGAGGNGNLIKAGDVSAAVIHSDPSYETINHNITVSLEDSLNHNHVDLGFLPGIGA